MVETQHQEQARYFTTTEACSCLSWRWRRPEGGCKHMLALRRALALLEAHKAKWSRSSDRV